METVFILAIVEMVVKYGIPGALAIIKAWQTEGEPTKEQIDALRKMTPPEDFFK